MKQFNSPIAASLLTGWLAFSGATLISTQALAETNLIDRVVAVVDDDIILQSQLQAKMQEQAMKLQAQNIQLPPTQELAQQVLDNLILEKVQLNRAKLTGISVTEEAINQQLQKIAQKNGLNLLQLQQQMDAQKPNGFKMLRSEIEKQLTIQKLRETEVISRTQVTESEINNYLTRQSLSQTKLNLKHILISIPESATPSQRQAALDEAQTLRRRIIAGEDFSQLAVRFSNGSKALQGGDLGWMQPSEIPTFFSEAANTLNVGETSQIIESPSGFHLIQLAGESDGSNQKVTEYHLHQFVVLSDNITSNEPPQSLITLTQSIKNLTDFKALNNRFADIPEEINRNSDLGWLNAGQLPPALAEIVTGLQPGQAIGPFANEQGWLIVFLEDTRLQTQNKQLQSQQAIQAVRMRKANEMFDVWLRRLKDEAYIRIQLDESTQS
ncbi:peptidylprolyl isomerase [Thiomicrorhabdus indica]|uniref:peptidylprolyl isomerase n=1 Tax=Thiomicrorhabdus indica TaxID=2267253 RepID=UPI00102DE6CA|nr:peptidylprolyl isomerase [Thiomicrorhabdus indica]